MLGMVNDNLSQKLDQGSSIISNLKLDNPGLTNERLLALKNKETVVESEEKGYVCSDVIFAYLSLIVKVYDDKAKVINPEIFIDLDKCRNIPSILEDLDKYSIIVIPYNIITSS
jgi:hypothetical protein